jgi:hypothetical protein
MTWNGPIDSRREALNLVFRVDSNRRGTAMETVVTVGLDLAKSVFQVHAVDASGAVVIRRALRRANLLDFFRKLPRCLVGREACVLDPIRVLPYGPAAGERPHQNAGHTNEPDHMCEPKEKQLAFHGAFTHD